MKVFVAVQQSEHGLFIYLYIYFLSRKENAAACEHYIEVV